MKYSASLNVVDGKVLCPRTWAWEDVGHCAQCKRFVSMTSTVGVEQVACRPDVDVPGTVIDGRTWGRNPVARSDS